MGESFGGFMGLFSAIGDALGIGGGDLFSGGLSILGGLGSNSASKKAANAQMAFQERMDNTKYQRSVEDLKAAGLNPMLAYTNGVGGAPSGASYTATDIGTPAANTALASRRNREEVENLKAENENIRETKSQIKSQTAMNKALAVKAAADAKLSSAAAAKTAAEIPRADVLSQGWRAVQDKAQSASDAVRGFRLKDLFKDQPTMDDLRRVMKENR